ncbi:MAG: response regulator [Eubacteriales bacterium]|nr:response regulator [Eubacteriales bacterium]
MSDRILIVDDESNIVEILEANLQREGYKTLVAYDGHTALKIALEENPDLILLDCMLPGIDGFDICKRLREERRLMPIIMLTAKSEEIDKVLGLELGADDYMTKPFSVREVLARVKAQLRRNRFVDEQDGGGNRRLYFGQLVIDEDAFQVTYDDVEIPLTLREFELVLFLAKHAGQVFSRETLLEEVWGYDYFGDVRTVDVTVRRTREKLEPDQDNYRYLLTKRGVGYYFNRDLMV